MANADLIDPSENSVTRMKDNAVLRYLTQAQILRQQVF